MEHEGLIAGHNGYDIPVVAEIPDEPSGLVIVGHGLFSSKDADTVKRMLSAFSSRGVAAVGFDLPGHGASPVDGEAFCVSNCLDDLASVEEHFATRLGDIPVSYFASSFGAYVDLVYLATRSHRGRRCFLRCAAIRMAELMDADLDGDSRAQLARRGYIFMETGFTAPMKMTRRLFEELAEYDPFELYVPDGADLCLIHGSADEEAPIDDARRFADFAHARFIEVPGAGHRFNCPGQMDVVEKAALDFLLP